MKRRAKAGLRLSFLVVVFCLAPLLALGIQTHGAPEGLYVHQGAHILYMAAMLIFAINIHRSGLDRRKAWRLVAGGAWLLLFWNMWAFTGHYVETLVSADSFIRVPGRKVARLVMFGWQEYAYYFLKMDHLFCFPAILLFYLGLKEMRRDFEEDREEEGLL